MMKAFALFLLVVTLAVPAVSLAAPTPTPTGMTYQKMLTILDNLVSFVLRVAGLIAVGVIIYYGVRMAMAGGNDAAYADARKGLNWALIGTLVIFGVYTIIATVRGAVESIGR